MRKYRITVAHNDKHHFTTDHISNPFNLKDDEAAARNLYAQLCESFPASMGFWIELGFTETVGFGIESRERSNG